MKKKSKSKSKKVVKVSDFDAVKLQKKVEKLASKKKFASVKKSNMKKFSKKFIKSSSRSSLYSKSTIAELSNKLGKRTIKKSKQKSVSFNFKQKLRSSKKIEKKSNRDYTFTMLDLLKPTSKKPKRPLTLTNTKSLSGEKLSVSSSKIVRKKPDKSESSSENIREKRNKSGVEQKNKQRNVDGTKDRTVSSKKTSTGTTEETRKKKTQEKQREKHKVLHFKSNIRSKTKAKSSSKPEKPGSVRRKEHKTESDSISIQVPRLPTVQKSTSKRSSHETVMGFTRDKKKWLFGLAFIAVTALALTFIVLYFTKGTSKDDDGQNAGTTLPPVPTQPPADPADIILDRYIKPTHYNLQVMPIMEENRFEGKIEMLLTADRAFSNFRIHSQNLVINDDHALYDSSNNIIPIRLTMNEQFQTVQIRINTGSAPAGNYKLSLSFGADFINGSYTGFYKTSYLNRGKYEDLVTTKFEPTYARQAFPCFDEPFFKATFKITIIHPNNLIALSNEQVELREPMIDKLGWEKTTFQTTPLMSTYTVAYVVSNFKHSESFTSRGIPVRVYSRPGEVENSVRAVEIAANVLDYYEEYTGIQYPLSKLDLIGIPGFISGAMENWGLVTYKENYILYNDNTSNVINLKQITAVIAHELAHMWWGNLVTLHWWNELYLNEGFASYIEYKGQQKVQSTLPTENIFITDELHGALRADMLKSHPLKSQNVLTPDQVTAQFDTISYNKGASILRMLEDYVSPANFQSAQKKYLNDFQYKTVISTDMLSYFDDFIKSKTDGKFVTAYQLMQNWIERPGFPILFTKRSQSQNGKTTITIEQRPYRPDQSVVWMVPIKYSTPNGQFEYLLTGSSGSFEIDLKDNQWFKLNTNSVGYYMVSYEEKDWDMLIDQLEKNPQFFSVGDRANLLFDAYQLTEVRRPDMTSAEEGQLMSYDKLFSLMNYLRNDKDQLPWSTASTILNSLKRKLSSIESTSGVMYSSYILDLIENVYESKINFEEFQNTELTEYIDLQLQNVVLSLACDAGQNHCLKNVGELFNTFVQTHGGIPSAIRGPIIRYGMKASTDPKVFDVLWKMYSGTQDATERSRLMAGMTATENSALLAQMIGYTQDQSLVNNEDFFSFQQNIAASSSAGRALVWNYIQNNWLMLVDRFGLNDRRLGSYIYSVCSGFSTQQRLNEMLAFFNKYPESGAGEANRLRAVETVQANIQWATKNEGMISGELLKRDKTKSPWLNFRLSEFVRPTNYDIELKVDVDNRVSNGKVKIEFDVMAPTEYIILHSRNLNITNYQIRSGDRVVSNETGAFYYETNHYYVIPLTILVDKASLVAELSFDGKIPDDELNGLYLSSYRKPNEDKPTYLATTQFETGYARKAFPCFDEPQFKAKFAFKIMHDKKYTAHSNMKVNNVRDIDPKWRETSFDRTVQMSTYILAFIVSDFEVVRSKIDDKFSCITFNPETNAKRCEYANEVGPKILDAYADYFGNQYQLPKVDQVAVPDFSFGAMENWGLVTYRDVYLLYDPESSPVSTKMSIAYIVAHELAHMWFGNQVTIKWWNELWLNEGFAEFMEYKGVEAVHPEWNYSNYFAITELTRVFETDSSANSRPILTKVQNYNDMQMIFDGVTYAKGASVIRMLEATIGEEKFREAIRNYMKRYAYQNTITTDLWNEFSAVLDDKFDVAKMMDKWISREGFPVVTIKEDEKLGYMITQKRFLKDGSDSTDRTIWHIPLTYKQIQIDGAPQDSKIVRIDFTNQSMSLRLDSVMETFVPKFNVDQKGVYIVNYPTSVWKMFAEGLSKADSVYWKTLSVLDRNSLINDAYYLAQAGQLSYEYALNITEFLRHETNYVVWQTAVLMMGPIAKASSQDGGFAYRSWLGDIVKERYETLTWDSPPGENGDTRRLRPLIMNLACSSDNQDCLTKAKQKFKQFIDSLTKHGDSYKTSKEYKPDPDTFPIILNQAMRAIGNDDNTEDYEKLLGLYEKSTDTGERNRYLQALTSVRNTKKLEELLKKSLDRESNFIRKQDFLGFLSSMAGNPAALDMTWKFYRDNYADFEKYFTLEDSILGRAVYTFALAFSTQERKDEILKLYKDFPQAGASELYRKQALEIIDANIKWSSKYYTSISKFLTDRCSLAVCPWKNYRIPDGITPKNYEMTLQVHNDEDWFNGTVAIQTDISVTNMASTTYLFLHASEKLQTSNIEIKASGGTENLWDGKQFRYAPNEFVIFGLKSNIKDNSYTIKIDFKGDIRDNQNTMFGLYKGFYYNENGGKTNLSSTQLEHNHARKMFPCFDEPRFKQPFDVTVLHQKSMLATFSNMPIEKRDEIGDWYRSKFQKTNVPMPTYLLAFVISDFRCKSKESAIAIPGNKLPIQTCASRVIDEASLDYSLEITDKVLRSYNDAFGLPYQMPKLDQIAIPQFDAGAMENWGLVLYRETELLWNKLTYTSDQQRRVTKVIAHELAHQWFGNSLTCNKWEELWLNEAFASYLEYYSISHIKPEWDYFNSMTGDSRITAFESDFSENAHPLIQKDFPTPKVSFNSRIIYQKGSLILHMLSQTMGPDNFMAALKQYQNDNINTALDHTKLYAALKKHWKHSFEFEKFMDSWTKQPGIPYLNITCTGDDKCTYKQARFTTKMSVNGTYVIPYSYYSPDHKVQPIVFLDKESGQLPHTRSEFLKANPNFQGYFIVNYDEQQWKIIINKMIKNEDNFVLKLSANDRSELLMTASHLTAAGLMDASIHVELFNYLPFETDYDPLRWYDRRDGFVHKIIPMTSARESLNAFERRIVSEHYTDALWKSKDLPNSKRIFNSVIVEMACRSGYKKCLDYVSNNYEKSFNNPGDVEPDFAETMARYGVQVSKTPAETIKKILMVANATEDSNALKAKLFRAPAMVNDWSLVKQYLYSAANQSFISRNLFRTILSDVTKNPNVKEQYLTWLLENQAFVNKRLESQQVYSLISMIAERTFDNKNLELLKKAANKFQLADDKLTDILDKNDNIMNTYGQKFTDWFDNNGCGTNFKPEKCPWTDMRVSGSIDPQRYSLDIRVNVTSTIFDGTVKIDIKTNASLEYLPVHVANQMQVELIRMSDSKGNAVSGIETFRYEPEMRIVLRFMKLLSPGEYSLRFSFNSSLLNNGLSGLYRSTYHEYGVDVPLASTQMEFYDARKMFPCFDEPAFKSIFSIKIQHEAHMNATFSNAPIKGPSKDIGNGWLVSEFEDTPPMTTYLVAILVSDYVCEGQLFEGVEYRVCAPRIHQHKLRYALDKAKVGLKTLQSLLKVPYPMKKLDLVAIPDFYYGAMENWGLITFRESALLYHENDTTAESKIRIASIIAHEIAHFWFGNLVTCEWWDALFLNEAFATLMQYPTVDRMEGNWDIYDMFLIYDFDRAVAADSVETTHALLRPISKTTLIDQFDSQIIYAKGASVFRMVESLMGRPKFFEALAGYMKKMEYKTSRPEDLLAAFDTKYDSPWSDVSMTELLQEWIFNSGLPYLNISKVDGTVDTFQITQERFLRRETPQSNLSTVWKVPISYYTSDVFEKQSIKVHVMKEKDETVQLSGMATKIIPKLNAGHTGFYLVNYGSLWQTFIDAMVHSFEESGQHIPVPDRAGLLFDAFTLAGGNKLKYAVPLSLSRYLKYENDTTPITIAIRAFDAIRKNVDLGSRYGKEFKQFVLEQFIPIYNELGWKEIVKRDDIMRSLRSKVLDFVCDYGHQDCLDKAAEIYKNWKVGKEQLSPNILPVVLKYGLRADKTGDEWQYVWGLYQNQQSPTLRAIYMNGLVGSPNQDMIRLLLDSALYAKGIRGQDSISTMLLVARSLNPTILETVWQFVQKNFDNFFSPESTLKPNDVRRLLNQLSTNYFFTEARKSELSTFLSTKRAFLSRSQYQSALNLIDSNIEWLQTRMIEIESFLLCGKDSCSFTPFRISENLQPREYTLNLKIDLEAETFAGSVTIDIDVKNGISLDYLNLHSSKSLNIISTKIFDSSNQEIAIGDLFRYDAMDFVVVPFASTVKTNKLKAVFEFNSVLADDMAGLYKSVYYDPNRPEGQRIVKLAATQFQAIDARKVFPCFDEPTFRSVFNVIIEHDPKMTVHSNMEVDAGASRSGLTKFKPTPPMVTYLLAFVVSDFKCNEGPSANGNVVVNICATPPESDSTKYAEGITYKIINDMSAKYSYDYHEHMNKMDLFAIPDFSAGAMENWGLLTFRETRLLWNEKTSDAANKMAVASVVAHEITHMWFGNLVTCKFWSDLWLNEAFASYMEYFSVHNIEPEWDYWQLFFVTDYIAGMRSDASSTSHSLIRNVQKPSDIPYISTIIYQKGASILRMFEQTFSESQFFAKLGQYLNENALKSVPSQTLIDKLATIPVSGIGNVRTFLENWTKQAGFPYINMTRTDARKFSLVQERFLSNGDRDTSGQTWNIPLTYYLGYKKSNDYRTTFFRDRETVITVSINTDTDMPIKFNIDSKGFYIVNYDIKDWRRWIELLKTKPADDPTQRLKLTSQDMAHLLFDASMLSAAGYLDYEISLGLTQALSVQKDFSVWATGSNILSGMWPYFRASTSATTTDQHHEKVFTDYAESLLKDIYDEYGLQSPERGVTDNRLQEQRLRQTVSAFACGYRMPRCLLEAQIEFMKWKQNDQYFVSPNVRATVLRYGIQASNNPKEDWNFLWDKYMNEHRVAIKLDYLQALAASQDRANIKLLLERALDPQLVRRQDYLSLWAYILRTPVGHEVAWQFFKDNANIIRAKRLTANQIGTLAGYFANYNTKKEQADELERFFVQNPQTGISAVNFERAKQTMKANQAWIQKYKKTVVNWFRDNTQLSSSKRSL